MTESAATAIHVQWSDDGRHIRKWDFKPFEGSTAFVAPSTNLEEAEKRARELRPEVLAFAHLMERKLRENDHKPGWKRDNPQALLCRIGDETRELALAVAGWGANLTQGMDDLGRGADPLSLADRQIRVGREAADVANFAMMVADRCGGLELPAALQSVPEVAGEAELPTTGDIVPTADLSAWLAAIVRGDWTWASNSPCKYVTLHIDTRRGAYRIEDRDGNAISFHALLRQSTGSLDLAAQPSIRSEGAAR